MEAKELRIGNWMYSNLTMQQFQVIAGDIDQICSCPFVVEPITLTDSFFEKLNAEKDKEYNAHYVLPINGDYGYMLFTKDESGYSVFIHIGDSSILLYHDIMYVHELQNLYFALTGEELTVKP